MKIALKPLGHQYEIYEPIAIPSYSDKQICEMKIDKSLLTHEKNKHTIQVLTGRALQNCNPNEYLCTMDSLIRDRHERCIEYLFNEQPMSKINKVCVFQSHKVSPTTDRNDQETILPIIHTVNYQEFTVTNPQSQLHIEFGNGTPLQLSFKPSAMGTYRKMFQQSNQRTSMEPFLPAQ